MGLGESLLKRRNVAFEPDQGGRGQGCGQKPIGTARGIAGHETAHRKGGTPNESGLDLAIFGKRRAEDAIGGGAGRARSPRNPGVSAGLRWGGRAWWGADVRTTWSSACGAGKRVTLTSGRTACDPAP